MYRNISIRNVKLQRGTVGNDVRNCDVRLKKVTLKGLIPEHANIFIFFKHILFFALPVAGQVGLCEKLSEQHAVRHVLEHSSL